MAKNSKTDWELDIEDIILTLFTVEHEDSTAYVTVDDVLPKMAERGYQLSRDNLGDMMGVVAADNGWIIAKADDDLPQIIPFAAPEG